MNPPQTNNPLHGVTLKAILEYLVAEYGWDRLGERINIHCFNYEPTINSSLKFLRKTDWCGRRSSGCTWTRSASMSGRASTPRPKTPANWAAFGIEPVAASDGSRRRQSPES